MLQDSIFDLIDEYIKHNIDKYKLETFNTLIEEYVYNILQLTYINISDIFYDIDILDIISIVNIIFINEYNFLADINSDSIINVLDIIAIVNIILN